MPFNQSDVDCLLAQTGRMCIICKKVGGVSVHHLLPVADGGTDDIENAAPLCPNCHNDVHLSYAPGQTTKTYTIAELRLHKEQTLRLASTRATPSNSFYADSRTEKPDELDNRRIAFRNILRCEIEHNIRLLQEYKRKMYERTQGSQTRPSSPIYELANLPIPIWSRTAWQQFLETDLGALSIQEYEKIMLLNAMLDEIGSARDSYLAAKANWREVLAKKHELMNRGETQSSRWNGVVLQEKDAKTREVKTHNYFVELFKKIGNCGNPIK